MSDFVTKLSSLQMKHLATTLRVDSFYLKAEMRALFDGRLMTGASVLSAVIDSGNFARAAEVLALSAPGVGRSIGRLESRSASACLTGWRDRWRAPKGTSVFEQFFEAGKWSDELISLRSSGLSRPLAEMAWPGPPEVARRVRRALVIKSLQLHSWFIITSDFTLSHFSHVLFGAIFAIAPLWWFLRDELGLAGRRSGCPPDRTTITTSQKRKTLTIFHNETGDENA
jgi:Bacterial regulatory helix-turn-helix protein, lysR family